MNPDYDVRLDPKTPAIDLAAERKKENLASLADLSLRLHPAITKTQNWLLSQQHEDGHWCGELEGDTILESEYILLLAWLGRLQQPIASQAAQYILQKQMPQGGWGLYPGGKLEISCSVKAYFALKLTGHDVDAEYMKKAREAILAHGGADAVNSFTRFYLALLGQISYEACPAVPPEMVLLPKWFPVNLYRISAWSRTILVPLSIMWAHRPVRRLEANQNIHELFIKEPKNWSELHCPGLEQRTGFFSWDRFFRNLDNGLKWAERQRLVPLRKSALQAAEKWMTQRFVDSDGLGAIFPPIIWSVIALKCLGYDDESSEVQYCHDQLNDLMIHENSTVRLQPCKSPVWDTALTLRALSASGLDPEDQAICKGVNWLLEKEVTQKGDWAQTVRSEPGGWFFEHRNKFYPDVDDTVMVMMVLRSQVPNDSDQKNETSQPKSPQRHSEAVNGQKKAPPHPLPERSVTANQRAQNWILAMQNRDGGWGAFDRNNDSEFLCHVPFADHNAMIDPSTPDLTARVLEALGHWGARQGDPAVERAIHYLRKSQEPDGSWLGRWGVNYIYGTWQVLAGLSAIGVSPEDPCAVKGGQWLMTHQLESGGWGESAGTYESPELRGQGPATASQTAWALLGLMAAGKTNHPAVTKGIRFLLETQEDNGTWTETEFTGTGFPRVFYLRYHFYPIYFPLLALSQWAQSREHSIKKPNH